MTSRSDSAAKDRDETPTEQADRNWNELLQELRVSQTGVQLLTGLLLTLPFQNRFTQLGDIERTVYLISFAAAVSSTAFLVAPVALHRMLFQEGEKQWLVSRGNLLTHVGLSLLVVAMTCVVWLIFDMVIKAALATVAAGLALGLFVALWWLVPIARRQLTKSKRPT